MCVFRLAWPSTLSLNRSVDPSTVNLGGEGVSAQTDQYANGLKTCTRRTHRDVPASVLNRMLAINKLSVINRILEAGMVCGETWLGHFHSVGSPSICTALSPPVQLLNLWHPRHRDVYVGQW